MLPIALPTLQNWSCHNCSGCCHQHLIEVSDDERRVIISQNWTTADGIPADQPVLVPHGGPPWKRRYRLGHQPNGACVFLNEQGLCRIHAKFGEAAKPAACRVYPYAFHPEGKRIAVSLRFSCPSVVKNLGASCQQNRNSIKTLASLVVPEGTERIAAPRLNAWTNTEWDDFSRVVGHFDDFVADTTTPLLQRLAYTALIATILNNAGAIAEKGKRLSEFMEFFAGLSVQEPLPAREKLDGIANVHFRLLVAQYARHDTAADLSAGLWRRFRLLKAALKFGQGRGLTPEFRAELKAVPFELMEQSFGPLPPEADELLTRYLRVKIQGIHFCGRAYYDIPFAEGMQALLLVVPSVFWIARWIAASQQRTQWTIGDIQSAVAMADHQHGYSPMFGSSAFRSRVRFLHRDNTTFSKLLTWYGQ